MGDSVRNFRYNLVRSDSLALTRVRTPFLIEYNAKIPIVTTHSYFRGMRARSRQDRILAAMESNLWVHNFSTAAFIAKPRVSHCEEYALRSGCHNCPF